MNLRGGAVVQVPDRIVDDALVSCRGLTVTVGERCLLADVDVSVEPGEVVALVGPNGAGKSTLLAALAGDRRVDCRSRGDVSLHGRPINDWPIRDLALRRAVLIQEHGITAPYSVRRIVEMAREPWRGLCDPRVDSAAVDLALAEVELTEFGHRDASTLSGGEQARVGVARVAAQSAQLVLLDEPAAAMDLRHQQSLLAFAARLAGEGCGVLVVLHDLTAAARIADRVLVLCAGRVVAAGPPAEVMQPEMLSAVYGCPVDVLHHPVDGSLIVIPAIAAMPAASASAGHSLDFCIPTTSQELFDVRTS